ncbi:hypothetical protein ACFLVC_04855, partial [Chloroflexota bacterium]
FKEVAEAMAAPMERAGGWGWSPNIHSLNPIFFNAGSSEASMRLRDDYFKEYYEKYNQRLGGGRAPNSVRDEIVLKPGMVFQFEPNVCLGRHRVNVGGNVIVTEKGNEELNEIGTRMQIASEA